VNRPGTSGENTCTANPLIKMKNKIANFDEFSKRKKNAVTDVCTADLDGNQNSPR
jgi:hypothetical protein